MQGFTQIILEYMAVFIAILIILPLHEFAHAFMAVKSGDLTPKLMGRYTINPIAHFDPLGLLMLLIVRFGWAKPVPVNPNNFKNFKKGCILVAIAGVTINFILAFLSYPIQEMALTAISKLLKEGQNNFIEIVLVFVAYFLQYFYMINISLMVFNLLPIYPLDGFRLYDSLIKRRNKVYYFLKQYSLYLLLGVIGLSYLSTRLGMPYLDIIGMLVELVRIPIECFWGLIL